MTGGHSAPFLKNFLQLHHEEEVTRLAGNVEHTGSKVEFKLFVVKLP